jgi:hypothetical protein
MGRCFISLVPAQDRYGDVTVLDEAAAVQSAIEPVAHASRLLRPFGVRPVSLRFPEQPQGFSHLRFGFVARTRRVGRPGGRLPGVRFTGKPVLLRFAGRRIESEFQIFRQCHHLGIGSAMTSPYPRLPGTEYGSVEAKPCRVIVTSVGSSLEIISEDIFFKRLARLRGTTLMLEY